MNKYTLQFNSQELETKYRQYRQGFTIPAFKIISVICFIICILRSILSIVLDSYLNLYIFVPLGLLTLICYFVILRCKISLVDGYLVFINHILMFYQYTVNVGYDSEEAYLFGQMMMTIHILIMLISDFKYAVLQLINSLVIKSCIAEYSHGVISVQTYLYTYVIGLMAMFVFYKTSKQQRLAFLQTINDNSYEKIIPPLLENPFAIFWFDQERLQFQIKISNFHEHPIFNPFQNNQQNLLALLRKYQIMGMTFEDFVCSRLRVSSDKYFLNKHLDLANLGRSSQRLTIKYSEIFITELLFMIVIDQKESQLQEQNKRINLLERVSKFLIRSMNKFLKNQLNLVNKSETKKSYHYQAKTKLMYVLTKFESKRENEVSAFPIKLKLTQFFRLFSIAYEVDIQFSFSDDIADMISFGRIFEQLLTQLMTYLSRVKGSVNLRICLYQGDFVDTLITVDEVSTLYVELQKNKLFRKTLSKIGPFDRVFIENDCILVFQIQTLYYASIRMWEQYSNQKPIINDYFFMQQSLLQKQHKSDNWLFTGVTTLIDLINGMETQIQNKELKQFMIRDSDCDRIIQQLKEQVIQIASLLAQKPKNLYRSLFSKFMCGRVFKIFGIQTCIDLLQLGDLLLLNSATRSLTEFSDTLTPILSILGIVTCSLFKTYLQAKTDQMVNLFVLRLRIVAEYLIYDKALRVQCISSKGDSDSHTANINTLLTADLDQIMNINYIIRDIWEATFLMTGCLIFLYHIEPHAGTIVVLTMLCAQVFNLTVTFVMMRSRKKMLIYKDLRVGLSIDVIEGIKQIKYLSWEETFSRKIMGYRKWEFAMLCLLKGFDGLCSIFWNNVSYVLMCAYVISSINSGKTLQDLNVFTLIAVFNTMTFPLGILPWTINSSLLSYVSLKRIAKFLDTQEIDPDDRFQLPYPQNQQSDVVLIEDLICEWPIEKLEQEKRAAKNQVSDDSLVFEIQDENQEFQLKIDRFIVKVNTLNFVIGKIGSGKSALFNAILNELQKYAKFEGKYTSIRSESQTGQRMLTISDQIIIKGTIGYCSQTSWVQNLSIRDNILFGKPFDQQLYNQVIDVCEIRKDINTFDKQDMHEIGPDGKNLSGGQKQRITLARALYQDCDIYLFDDIFSSLDVHIADQIFQSAIIDFLLRRGKTVLLITSHYRYLNMVPSNVQKQIVYLDNGQIISNQTEIDNYLKREEQPKDEEEPNIEEELNQVLEQKKEQQFEHQEVDDEANQEKRETGKINSSTWTTYFSSMGWVLLIFWVITNFFMQGAMSLIDFWMKSELRGQDTWLHQITVFFNNSFTDTMFYLTVAALLVTFIRAVFYVSTALRSAWIMFSKLNKVLMNSIMKFFDKTNAGRIINRIQDDTYMVDDDLSWTTHCLLENVSRVTGFSIGLIILEPIFVIILLGVIFLFYLVSKTYIKSNREIKRLRSINQGSLLQSVNETLTGIKVIRAFNKTSYFSEYFLNKLSNWILSDQCGVRTRLWFGVRLNLMSNLILMCVSLFVIVTILFKFSDDYTVQALAITYSMVVLNSFYDLFSLYLRLEAGIVSVERIKQYYNNETENIDEVKEQLHQTLDVSENSVVFKNISLTYDENGKQALKNFSLSIKKGEKVAFVGRTGSGKTSILNILFGLYPHQSGDIIINGKNTKDLSLRQQRQQLSVVPQFGFLYNATVKENLDPMDQATKADIERLFTQTGFQLRGISNSSNNTCNADFVISQNGANLSNGEKQVLNFLRIVLLNKEIICLDEATSNMDPKTDQVIIKLSQLLHDLLFEFAKNRTLLVITHRLENIQIYDKIIVMEQGEIVEQGAYEELIRIEGGFFNRLMKHHQEMNTNK